MHKSQSTATSLGSGKGWNAQNLQTSLICWPKYDLYRGSLWFSYSLFLVFLFSIFFLEHTRLQMDLEKVEQVRRNIKYKYFLCHGFEFLHYLIAPFPLPPLPPFPLPPSPPPPSPPSPHPPHPANRWWKYSNLSWFNAKFSLLIYKEMSIS